MSRLEWHTARRACKVNLFFENKPFVRMHCAGVFCRCSLWWLMTAVELLGWRCYVVVAN